MDADIIKMAQEAGIPIEFDWAGRPSTLVVKDGGLFLRSIDDLERFARLVMAAERKRCSEVAYEFLDDPFLSGHGYATGCRDAILAREEND